MSERRFYCRICGRVQAKWKFSHHGQRTRMCKKCQQMPKPKRERLERLDELHRMLHQSNISSNNLQRLTALCQHADPSVAALAHLVLDVARVFPHKRNRWRKLASSQPALFDRALQVLGIEFFEDLLAGYGDFENPLWHILEARGATLASNNSNPAFTDPEANLSDSDSCPPFRPDDPEPSSTGREKPAIDVDDDDEIPF